MELKDYTNANKAAWDQASAIHEDANFADLIEGFKSPGYSTLDTTASEIFEHLVVKSKDVAQLCCNNGRELLSIKNMGARRCCGFDISEKFINQAQRLAQVSGQDCEFIATDIYDILPCYDHSFDVVFTTIGVLGWMPDLGRFFNVVRRILRQHGWLFVYEMHPFLDVFEPDDQAKPPLPVYSYFKKDPWVDTSGLDYFSGKNYPSVPTYYFHHTLSEIFNCCLENNLEIRSFKEYPHDISMVYAHLEKQETELPMCFTLTAQRS